MRAKIQDILLVYTWRETLGEVGKASEAFSRHGFFDGRSTVPMSLIDVGRQVVSDGSKNIKISQTSPSDDSTRKG